MPTTQLTDPSVAPEQDNDLSEEQSGGRDIALAAIVAGWGTAAIAGRNSLGQQPQQGEWVPPSAPPQDQYQRRVPPNGQGMAITVFHNDQEEGGHTFAPNQPFEIWMAVYDRTQHEIGPDGRPLTKPNGELCPKLITWTKVPSELWHGTAATGTTEFEKLAPTFMREGDVAVFESNRDLHVELDKFGHPKLDKSGHPVYRYVNPDTKEPIDPLIVLEARVPDPNWHSQPTPSKVKELGPIRDVPGVSYRVTQNDSPGAKRELIGENDPVQLEMTVTDNFGNKLRGFDLERFNGKSPLQQPVPFMRDLLLSSHVASGDKISLNVSAAASTAWTLSYPAHSPESQALLGAGKDALIEFGSYIAMGLDAKKLAAERHVSTDDIIKSHLDDLKHRNAYLEDLFRKIVPDPTNPPAWVIPSDPIWKDASGKPMDLHVQLEIRKQPYLPLRTPTIK